MTRPTHHQPAPILLAEDDPDDRFLMIRAVRRSQLDNDLHVVNDGEELMDYLLRRGLYEDPCDAPRPGLILLDLNMPRKDGREALREIKNCPALRRIPVVVFTTSASEEDVSHSYNLGVNAFITKPATLEELTRVLHALRSFWFKTVRLPVN